MIIEEDISVDEGQTNYETGSEKFVKNKGMLAMIYMYVIIQCMDLRY